MHKLASYLVITALGDSDPIIVTGLYGCMPPLERKKGLSPVDLPSILLCGTLLDTVPWLR